MEGSHFDSLVKSLATGRNRRSVIKGILGLGGAAIAGGALAESDAEAARRAAPTPRPVSCPAGQQWDGAQCVCASGQNCGSACCQSGSECCDGSCCWGHCANEEFCCPYDNWCEAVGECCQDGATCCGEQGCVVIEEGECGCDGLCPEGFACCGGQCCAAGFCAGDICCALGVCNGECIQFEGIGCCNGTIYETAYVMCCGGDIYLKDGTVCCDDVPHMGNCCVDGNCPTCVDCENHVCGEPRC